MGRVELTTGKRIFLYIENFFMYIYLVCAFINIALALIMFFEYHSASKKYYFNLISRRLRIKEFSGTIELTPSVKPCGEFPSKEKRKEGQAILSYLPRIFLDINSFQKVGVQEITNKVLMFDSNKDQTKVMNTNFSAYFQPSVSIRRAKAR